MDLNLTSSINGEPISVIYNAAFAAIYNAYNPDKGTFLTIDDIKALAWDATGKVYEKRETYNPEHGASVRTWASKIAQTLFMDFIRKESKWQFCAPKSTSDYTESDAYDYGEVSGEGGKYISIGIARETAENEALSDMCIEAIEDAIDELQPRDSLIIRKHIEGYSDKEIAEELGITYSNVRKRLHEIRKVLRSNLYIHGRMEAYGMYRGMAA